MRLNFVLGLALGLLLSAVALRAQPKPLTIPWRGAGPTPCVGSDGGILQCPSGPRILAVRAGHLFDSKTGQMLTRQLVIVSRDPINTVRNTATLLADSSTLS